jgi:hypothetical protein
MFIILYIIVSFVRNKFLYIHQGQIQDFVLGGTKVGEGSGDRLRFPVGPGGQSPPPPTSLINDKQNCVHTSLINDKQNCVHTSFINDKQNCVHTYLFNDKQNCVHTSLINDKQNCVHTSLFNDKQNCVHMHFSL